MMNLLRSFLIFAAQYHLGVSVSGEGKCENEYFLSLHGIGIDSHLSVNDGHQRPSDWLVCLDFFKSS
jgi:hypothetical protein